MDAGQRREKILNKLNKSIKPVKGTELSKEFNVSRQVIVQDIALLRARGEDILATPQGYIIPRAYKENKLTKKIVCKHEGYDEIEDELKTIVDLGGKIVDVIVEHPLYGEIKSPLEISSRLDLKEFMDNIRKTKAEPLSSLTEGIHIHTIEVDDEKSLEKIRKALIKKKYLINGD
ncbi:transcription repressor NadR [Clostridium sp. Cult1]|uniref:transcription repressor NadR n=1 Tax=Clostridium sp. Cult1 TaxID=2079002 RepID=UPI001F279E1F|nr:transcription repressor NadR [Clostridium sp. Cult1]MCF6462808.1 transcription repressor NadR [Clostridium sp. Cult1]